MRGNKRVEIVEGRYEGTRASRGCRGEFVDVRVPMNTRQIGSGLLSLVKV